MIILLYMTKTLACMKISFGVTFEMKNTTTYSQYVGGS